MDLKKLRPGNTILGAYEDEGERRYAECEVLAVDSVNYYFSDYTVVVGSNPKVEYFDEFFGLPITEEKLIEYGFKDDLVGGVGFSINYIDRHIELIESDGKWYPQFIQEPEMAHEDCQIVSLPYIEYWHELEDLHKVLIGEELKNQKR